MPQGFPTLTNRLAASRYLTGIILGIQFPLYHMAHLPGNIEFLGDDHRHGSFYALSDLGVRGKYGDRTVFGNLNKGIEIFVIQRRQINRRFGFRLAGLEQVKTNYQASTGQRTGAHEFSSAKR